jgi:hypothetical protein
MHADRETAISANAVIAEAKRHIDQLLSYIRQQLDGRSASRIESAPARQSRNDHPVHVFQADV